MIWQIILNLIVGNWPIIVCVVLLATLPWTLKWVTALISSPAGRTLVMIVVACGVTWYVARSFDEVLFDHERAKFKQTLDGIDAANEAALNEALIRQKKQADENNKNLVNALYNAGVQKAKDDKLNADLQDAINNMPDNPVPDANGCVQKLDPVLRDILRGRK